VNWRYKALLQAGFSICPAGHEINYWFRRHVSKTIPAAPETIALDYAFAEGHLAAFRQHGHVSVEDALFFEFGAGWDLTIPLSFYALGAERQIVTDLRPLLKQDLVAGTIRALRSMRPAKPPLRLPRELAESGDQSQLRGILQRSYGIDYRAPFDARQTGFADGSVDYITATKVLSFIPVMVLQGILRECHRILRPGGMISFLLDYRDNNSYFDPNISCYNFLRYSDRAWETLYNFGLNYQNRLRHCDYKDLFKDAAFAILQDQPGYDGPIERARHILESIPLAERFKAYAIDDLAPVRGVFLLRKAPAGQNAQPRPVTVGAAAV
jgi:SAM-dependent methyltransferase